MHTITNKFATISRALGSIAIAIMLSTTTMNSMAANIATTYDNSCAACHDSGALGALKKGDSTGWQQLKQQKGMPALVKSVKNGMTQMPAGGLCNDCSDEDYRKLIEHMGK